MAKFQIFTYMFRPVMERQAGILFEEFDEIDVEANLKRKQELAGGILSDTNNLHFEFNDTEYSHRTYIAQDGIYVMRIANNGHKPRKVEADFKISEVEDHPSSLVIIDNRKDRQVVAVECNSAFGKKPSLPDILQTTLRKALYGYRLTLDVVAKYHTSEFWKVVDDCQKLKGVDSVTFPFPYPNLPQISLRVGELMNEVARKTNSEPTLNLKGQDKENVRLDRKYQWLHDAVEACAASGRPICIKPKGAAEIKIGVESPVYEEISNAALAELDAQDDLFNKKFSLIVEFLNRIKLVYE